MCHGHLQHQCINVIMLLKLNHQFDYDMTEVEIVLCVPYKSAFNFVLEI